MSMKRNTMQTRDDSYVPVDPLSRTRLRFKTQGESKTRQSEKINCDVNVIVEKFARTGQMPPARSQPMYADVTELQGDLTEQINKSRETQERYIKEQMQKQAEAAKPSPAPSPASAAPQSPPTLDDKIV